VIEHSTWRVVTFIPVVALRPPAAEPRYPASESSGGPLQLL
jgi:hypothetical protein